MRFGIWAWPSPGAIRRSSGCSVATRKARAKSDRLALALIPLVPAKAGTQLFCDRPWISACAGDVPALDCLFQIAPRQRLCKYRNDGRIAGGAGNNGLHPHHHGLVLGVAPVPALGTFKSFDVGESAR